MGSLNDRQFKTLVQDVQTGAESYAPEITGSAEFGTLIAAKYTAATPSPADGDFVFLRSDADGYLMCALKSGITVGGDLAVDVWSFRTSANVDADAWVYTHDESLAAVSEVWQGFGGYDETADRFRALPISTDHAAEPASPQIQPVGGEYRAAADTYDDGDSVIFHMDVKGHLLVSSDSIYAEDSGHTSADEGTFILGIRTDTLGTGANIAGTDADYMGLQMNAKGSLYTDVSSVLGSDMSVSNGIFSVITDNTTAVVVETAGTKKALNVNVTDGTNDMPTMDAVGRAGYVYVTDGTNTQPTGDVVARTIFVTHNDGTNEMPAGDAVGRSIYTAVGDGTTTAVVNTAFAETEAAAQASLMTTSLVTGWNNAGSNLMALEVNTDNAATDGTPNVLNVGGVYKSSLDTYADNDASPLHMNSGGELLVQAKGYDTGTDSNKIFEVNPVSEHHVEETLATATVQGNGTTYYYIDMDGYRYFSIQCTNTSGGEGDNTYTLEATNQDDGTAAASCAYQDVTTALAGVASWVDINWFAIIDTPSSFKYVRVKVVRANDDGAPANDGAWTIFAKKMY